MSFQEEYKQKLVTADEAVKVIKSGDQKILRSSKPHLCGCLAHTNNDIIIRTNNRIREAFMCFHKGMKSIHATYIFIIFKYYTRTPWS